MLEDPVLQPFDIIVNCSGMAANRLAGVMDEQMYATRGHMALVRAPLVTHTVTLDCGDAGITYIIPRGDGTVCLGGTRQEFVSNPLPDPHTVKDIIASCTALDQGLKGAPVIKTWAGLRPSRMGGVRVEASRVEGKILVHNYGHGGFGFQASWGCAQKVAMLVQSLQLSISAKTSAKL